MVNQSVVPADLLVTEGANGMRAAVAIAKATFRISNGELALDDEAPLPILHEDLETELGLLPRDTLVPGPDSPFEMVLLAAAYGRGAAAGAMPVRLAVGERQLELHVSGDRVWVATDSHWFASEPAPFARLPLTWSRTFGGKAEAWIDASTPVWVEDPVNPEGRGFDAVDAARGLASWWGTPPGFPRLEVDTRPLPNVEHPRARISQPGDAPEPYCWATLPISNRLIPKWLTERRLGQDPRHASLHPLQRCHPDLCFETAPLGADVVLCGCHPEGDLRFRIPNLRVGFDFDLGGRTGHRRASPQLMVLLADEKRLTITYRLYFQFRHRSEEGRSLRLVVGEE